jgi:CheY-like chemotaxis protein
MRRTPLTMLIADDSHVTQQVLAEAARASKLPLRLTVTDNGRECLTLLNGANIDLAFIDVHMPEFSGIEVFWSARKQGIQTFVTLMSNPPAAEAVAMAIKLRAYEFLFKPFNAEDATGIIKTYARISSPTKILIVDDSSTVRQIVQKVVNGSVFDCQITEAGDGETAVMLCRSTEFDTVFLDRNMPGMDGLATLKLLHSLQPSLKIVMMSSEHDADKEQQGDRGRHLRFPAEAVSFAGCRPRAARGLWPAFAEPEGRQERTRFRSRHRGQHHTAGPQDQRTRVRISVVRHAAASAELRRAPCVKQRDCAGARCADRRAGRPGATAE